jgi:hypothetical protein
MGKAPKTVDEEVAGEIEVDILNQEMTEGLPHWLDPMVKYSGLHDEKRKAKQRARTMAIQARRNPK